MSVKKFNSIWRPCTQHKFVENVEDIVITKGNGLEVFDENGNKYWDLIASWWVNIHGHCNKYIADAIAHQVYELDHIIAADFLHKPAIKLIEMLKKEMNNRFSHFFFADNGSTSVEIAMKMAFQYHTNTTGGVKKTFITFEGGYHGDTFACMALNKNSPFAGVYKEVLPFEVFQIPFPCNWAGCDDVQSREDEAIALLEEFLSKNNKDVIAAVFEPLLQGSAGMRMCRVEFMNRVVSLLKSYNIIVIFDEVFTAFGRTGKMFAYQHLDFAPDIICFSKGITAGFLPFGLVCCVEEIYNAFYADDVSKAFLHSHSYACNPISCACAVASLELFAQNNLMQEVQRISDCYLKLLPSFEAKLAGKIANPRVMGCVFAFDVKLGDSQYGSSFSRQFKFKAFEKGLILRPLGNTVYIVPPYCITNEQIESALGLIAGLVVGLVEW
jgi:adenosylmethionine-8-amino-7-oxononanoate aminotransferase